MTIIVVMTTTFAVPKTVIMIMIMTATTTMIMTMVATTTMTKNMTANLATIFKQVLKDIFDSK